jgi:CheY-like chemotaxis protein
MHSHVYIHAAKIPLRLLLCHGIRIEYTVKTEGMGEAKTNVLIIDDDLDFQMMISIILGNRGFKVRCLLEGKANAVSRMARKSDIVLLDMQLPGTSGADLGRQLKTDPHTESIPIILISGHADGEDLLEISQADAFIGKPFSLSRLLKKIDELLLTYYRGPA